MDDDIETPLPPVPGRQPHERFDSSTSSRPFPDSLQNFFSDVGVLSGVAAVTERHNNDAPESVFESYFDLTDERLSFVFNMFDKDKDGKISYENLRHGLIFQTAGMPDSDISLLDETSFQYLIKHFDLNNSGDISLEEFSDGIRKLMLRSLFRQRPTTLHEGNNNDDSTLHVIDYDAIRVDSFYVQQQHDGTLLEKGERSIKDFYFEPRPDWVKTRWIHVAHNQSRATAALTMNRLAVKYLLHPLALEDALSRKSHHPKAEAYSDHYFIMVPVFYIEWELVKPKQLSHKSSSFSLLLACLLRLCRKQRVDDTKVNSPMPTPRQLAKIRSQMVSIFVNVPKDDTIITFTGGDYGLHKTVDGSNPLWQRVQQELHKSFSKLRQYDAQYLTYALLDEAVDLIDPIMTTLRHEIEREGRQAKFRNLDRIHHLRREMEKVSRKFKPFVRLLTHVIEDDAINPGATVYMRDVLDNLECFDEELRQLISECEALRVEADKIKSQQMDQTLYTLTVVSVVFLPAQFLTGVWGMNFDYMPELDKPWGYKMFWAIASCIMLSLLGLLNCGRLR